MVALHTPPPPAQLAHDAAQSARDAASREAAQHDAILVRRFQSGDEDAFTEIVSRYHAKMLNVALRRLGNHADAEEIAQDTFIRAHRGLAAFRGESSLAAWLYRIAVNLSCNRHWYFFRRCRHTTLSLDTAVSDTNPTTRESLVPGEGASPVQAACLSEFAGIVASCIAQLPLGQREILALCSVQQHSYLHISRVLGIHVGTTKSRIARARRALRVLLGKAYPELRHQTLSLSCFEAVTHPPRFETAGA